jgi:PAS domain S-box-containing protein
MNAEQLTEDRRPSNPTSPGVVDVSGVMAEAVSSFLNASSDEVDALIEQALGKIGRALDMDLATVLVYEPDSGCYRVDHQWVGLPIPDPGFRGLRIDDAYRWLRKELEKDRPFLISQLRDWPAEATKERETCEQVGIKSVLWVPFGATGGIKGYVAYNALRAEHRWDDLDIDRLLLFGGILAGALQRGIRDRKIEELRRFEGLVSRISAEYVNLPANEFDARMEAACEAIGEMLGLERVFLVQFESDRWPNLETPLGWITKGLPTDSQLLGMPWERSFPWVAGRIRRGESIVCRDVEEMPHEEAGAELAYLRATGIRSGVLIPLKNEDLVIGVLIIDSFHLREWPEGLVRRLHLLGELFGNLLARRRAERDARDRLEFEHLIGRVSKTFIDLPAAAIDDNITSGLEAIGEFMRVDRCALGQFSEDGRELRATHSWGKEGNPQDDAVRRAVATDRMPWLTGRLLAGEPVVFSSPDRLPMRAVGERDHVARMGIQASAIVPLITEDMVLGCLAVEVIHGPRTWPSDTLQRLNLAGEIFSNALTRKRQWLRLHERGELLRATLDRAPAGVAVADLEGRLVQANPKFCEMLGYTEDELANTPIKDITFPEDYHLTEAALATLAEGASETTVVHEKRYFRKDGRIVWASVHSSRLDTPSGEMRYVAAVIVDISERKEAEQRAREAYDQIARLKNRLELENTYLREEIDLIHGHEEMIGRSPGIRDVLVQVEQVAKTDSSVLITGETGTGKELVAHAVHRLSSRCNRAMVTVNCAALPGTLIEAELFGREKGAYTGALTRQMGRFEAADGSTLFLDEVGELPLDLQSKLLRVLQTGEFERLGSTTTRRVDIRLVAATNRDLWRMAKDGRYREDLYYRISVFPIEVPPLRERIEDIPPLVWAFVQEFGERMGKSIEIVPRRFMEALQRYPWPGNVRELRNVIERAMIVSSGERLEVHLPSVNSSGRGTTAGLTLAEAERQHILSTLKRSSWRVRGSGGAAELLELKPSTLESRMKKLGIRRPH